MQHTDGSAGWNIVSMLFFKKFGATDCDMYVKKKHGKRCKVVRTECMKNSSLDGDSTKECINGRLFSQYPPKKTQLRA